jgi:hypothetical protein
VASKNKKPKTYPELLGVSQKEFDQGLKEYLHAEVDHEVFSGIIKELFNGVDRVKAFIVMDKAQDASIRDIREKYNLPKEE